MIVVENSMTPQPVNEAVLFPFDDFSIPWSDGLELALVSGQKHPDNPVVRMGKPGEPDSKSVAYYGTVIRINEEYRMWYIGTETPPPPWPGWGVGRICYAVSRDGIHWKKPKLGLVKYNGDTQNNLVALDASLIASFVVLHDPEDPDSSRRFKMTFESRKYNNTMGVAYSPDGLQWKESPHNPVKREILEMSGLIKFNGCYYVNAQVPCPRTMLTFTSYDFEHWTNASILSFRRHNIPPRPPVFARDQGEQVHLGASLWNRGNVHLGFYGQWHGPKNDDRRFVDMDIGLIVGNDAIHYREPIPDFRMISCAEERDGASPCLVQGQGFENIGEQTLVWYGSWREGEVRVARWALDRLGYYAPYCRAVEPHFISSPLRTDSSGTHLFVNADGLSQYSYLRVEICDQQFRGLAGYSGNDSVPIKESGFRQTVTWRDKKMLEKFDQPIRIRVSYEGLRAEDARVYAVYVS